MKYWLLSFWLLSAATLAECLPLHPPPLRVTLPAPMPVLTDIQLVQLADHSQMLQFRSADTFHLRQQIELGSLGIVQPLLSHPLVEDANLDGVADHLWLLTQQGQLWRVALAQPPYIEARLIADLTDAGLHFKQALMLVRARLPRPLAPANWRTLEHHQVMLLAYNPLSGQDVLFNLRIPISHQALPLIRFEQLLNRTEQSLAEQAGYYAAANWQAILSRSGWFLELSGQLSSWPRVVAGVIYAPVVKFSEGCHATEQQLYALQLYTAAQIYQQRRMVVPFLAESSLAIAEQPDKSISLLLQGEAERIVLINRLLKLSSECHQCTSPLTLDKFPLWLKLATYRDERGAN